MTEFSSQARNTGKSYNLQAFLIFFKKSGLPHSCKKAALKTWMHQQEIINMQRHEIHHLRIELNGVRK